MTYFLNMMGIINKDFIEENGNDWCCGRIDCDNDTKAEDELYGHYGTEHNVPIMDSISWIRFGYYLEGIRSDTLLSYKELEEGFEEATGYKINYWKDKND